MLVTNLCFTFFGERFLGHFVNHGKYFFSLAKNVAMQETEYRHFKACNIHVNITIQFMCKSHVCKSSPPLEVSIFMSSLYCTLCTFFTL
jgi:hypothetical protein